METVLIYFQVHISVHLFMSWDQNAGWCHSMKNGNRSPERVAKFKYLGTTLTYQNSIEEEVKSRLKSDKACYHSVQNVLSSSLLSTNIKLIKLYRTIIFLVLYECKTWSLRLREKRKLWVFENRVLRIIFWPKRDEAKGEWRKLHTDELNDLYSSSNILRVIRSIRMR